MSPARKARIEETIRLLVKELAEYPEILAFRDFHDICIRLGVGVDPRTAEGWLRACLANKVLRISRESTPKLKLYERGPDFDRYKDKGRGGGS